MILLDFLDDDEAVDFLAKAKDNLNEGGYIFVFSNIPRYKG